ncbi:MAG: amino acid permease [Chloroflexi bacterium]|nr:amino acid permease [Chloroflexota bacterium]
MNEAQHLRGTLGLGQAVALGVSGTLGGGIFVLVGSAVGHAGPAALLAFALAFAAALCIALPYAELAGRYPRAGGAYAATRSTLGPGWAYLNGWAYLGAWVFASLPPGCLSSTSFSCGRPVGGAATPPAPRSHHIRVSVVIHRGD